VRRTVASPHAPKAIGPYSQGVVTDHADGIQMLHAAGQIPIDPATGELVAGDVAAQADRVMRNISHVLAEAGMGFGHVVKTTVFLVDLADFAAMNDVYSRFFQGEYPARSTIQVAGLPKGARVEIEVHAVRHPPAGKGRPSARKAARGRAGGSARKAAPKAMRRAARKPPRKRR
jgi:2-iminobutanoate/2-iminopropanoate deaminase